MNEAQMNERLDILESKIDALLHSAPKWYESIPDVGVRCWTDGNTHAMTHMVIAYHEGEERPYETKNPCPGIYLGPTRWKEAKPVNSVFN